MPLLRKYSLTVLLVIWAFVFLWSITRPWLAFVACALFAGVVIWIDGWMNRRKEALMYTWENELTSDRWEFRKDNELIGYVEPAGGSFKCVVGGAVIAFRPDLRSAQKAVSDFHIEQSKETRLNG